MLILAELLTIIFGTFLFIINDNLRSTMMILQVCMHEKNIIIINVPPVSSGKVFIAIKIFTRSSCIS